MRYAILTAFVALSAGCVPVTEPLGDIEKAEPDKTLVGMWKTKGFGVDDVSIDVPEVKGNPKGLMRSVHDGKLDMWFFTTKIGKHTYGNVISEAKGVGFVEFAKEGAFAEWKKGGAKGYFVFKYSIDGDSLTVDSGNDKAFKKLMDDEKIRHLAVGLGYYDVPTGWLAKYLDKTGPDKIFDGASTQKYERMKKK